MLSYRRDVLKVHGHEFRVKILSSFVVFFFFFPSQIWVHEGRCGVGRGLDFIWFIVFPREYIGVKER